MIARYLGALEWLICKVLGHDLDGHDPLGKLRRSIWCARCGKVLVRVDP